MMKTRLTHKLTRNALLALSMLFSAAPVLAQQAVASLDRSTVFEGDSVQLRIALDNAAATIEPDYSELTADFEVSNTGTNTQMSIRNGRRQVSTQFTVLLDPLRVGKIVIPAIKVGNLSTQPLTLTVMPRPTGGDQVSDLFIEVEATPLNPYVQAQVLYVVRLYHALPITEGSLGEPESGSAVIERLGDDNAYDTNRNGRRYRVIERRFALFAERSGKMTIPGVGFRGRLADANQAGRFNSLFNRGRRISVNGNAIELTVRPKPASFSGDYWLPAAELKIREVWPNGAPEFKVGEPETRSIISEATGLLSAQLPEFHLPQMDAAKIYPDQPEVQTRTDRTWVLGKRVDKFAIVPSRVGTMVLPEIRIPWWDTQADRERTIVIPAREIEVLPGVVDDTASVMVAAGQPAIAGDRLVAGSVRDGDLLWQQLTATATILWLVTLFLFLRARRGATGNRPAPAGKPAAANSNFRRDLKRACNHADSRVASVALLGWAGEVFQAPAPGNLRKLAAQHGDTDLANEIRLLDQSLYAPGPGEWQGQRLWSLCRGGIAPQLEPGAKSAGEVLPALFKIGA